MVSVGRILCTILKIFPLSLYVRAAACKFEMPILRCDTPRCHFGTSEMALRLQDVEPFPANASECSTPTEAVVEQGSCSSCTPTGNTAELQHWCEHGWTPWLNGLLHRYKLTERLTATCTASTGFALLRVLGAVELSGYVLLWLSPQLGAFLLSVFMGAGLRYHLSYLQEPAAALVVQLALFSAAVLVLYLENAEAEHEDETAHVPSPPPSPKKEDALHIYSGPVKKQTAITAEAHSPPKVSKTRWEANQSDSR